MALFTRMATTEESTPPLRPHRTLFFPPDKLGKARPYVFLGAFVVGMLLTPPDLISQTLLAVPVYLLYEIGIIMSRVLSKKPDEVE